MEIRRQPSLGLAMTMALLACGGHKDAGSGLSPKAKLVDLSPAETEQLCAWAIDTLAKTDRGRTTDCNGHPCTDAGATCDDFRKPEVCVDALGGVHATCTVGAVEDCVGAMKAANNLCSVLTSRRCSALVDCFL